MAVFDALLSIQFLPNWNDFFFV